MVQCIYVCTWLKKHHLDKHPSYPLTIINSSLLRIFHIYSCTSYVFYTVLNILIFHKSINMYSLLTNCFHWRRCYKRELGYTKYKANTKWQRFCWLKIYAFENNIREGLNQKDSWKKISSFLRHQMNQQPTILGSYGTSFSTKKKKRKWEKIAFDVRNLK